MDNIQQKGPLRFAETKPFFLCCTRPCFRSLGRNALFELPALFDQESSILVVGTVKDRLEAPQHVLHEVIVTHFRIVRDHRTLPVGALQTTVGEGGQFIASEKPT